MKGQRIARKMKLVRAGWGKLNNSIGLDHGTTFSLSDGCTENAVHGVDSRIAGSVTEYQPYAKANHLRLESTVKSTEQKGWFRLHRFLDCLAVSGGVD
jgi:hypothetical protein